MYGAKINETTQRVQPLDCFTRNGFKDFESLTTRFLEKLALVRNVASIWVDTQQSAANVRLLVLPMFECVRVLACFA